MNSGDLPKYPVIPLEQLRLFNATRQHGFLWMTSGADLVKYDGTGFTSYQHDPNNSTSVSHNVTGELLEDRQGRIWVGSHNGLILTGTNLTLSLKLFLNNLFYDLVNI